MPFHNRVDKVNRIVFVDAIGEILIEDLIANELKILGRPDYNKNFSMLLDLSMAKPHHSVNLDKVKMSKEFVESIQERSGNCKWAVYAPDDSAYAFANMFEVLSKDISIATKVFRDSNEAKEWLGI